ncbi:MAG: type II toxin-antitoxin system PemK/MazF family toxin [Parachlamydiaceae bacterium]|nr:type II toxin-antitoxin system PemK/MazF family toxin [Parachlamydiaceae bacterium]
MTNSYPKCGDVYWIDLDPTTGSETKKRRPCLILSNDVYNKYSSRVIAAPITSQLKSIYPCEMIIDVSGRPGKVMLDQIRSFDKSRLKGKLCMLEDLVMEQVGVIFKNLFDFI